MQTDHAVDVLNGLIKTTLDSANGYRDAANRADAPQYRSMYLERGARRRQLADELQREVRLLGGAPQTSGGVAGKVHNAFLGLKEAVAGSDDKTLIDEVERGEDHIKERFEHALREDDLPTTVRETLSRAYAEIRADHDEVSRIKHALH